MPNIKIAEANFQMYQLTTAARFSSRTVLEYGLIHPDFNLGAANYAEPGNALSATKAL